MPIGILCCSALAVFLTRPDAGAPAAAGGGDRGGGRWTCEPCAALAEDGKVGSAAGLSPGVGLKLPLFD
eukprot:8055499-Prorocentrum_lima.AAC.1